MDSLSRTSSSASFSSSEEAMTSATISASRRTRKRFTNAQLTVLENLFHQNSHPSREEREGVAKAGQMEIKSVTIWFQNKRQTERKVAASKESNTSRTPASSSPTFSNSSKVSSDSTSSSLSSRPSLDRVASRTELRNHPRTPTRRHIPTNGSGPIWDHMPSSPLATSPSGKDFVDFNKNPRSKRTLEWACAAARLADKEGPQGDGGNSHPSSSLSTTSKGRTVHRQKQEYQHPDVTPKGIPLDLDLTDDEAEEAITPPSTWGRDDIRWKKDASFGAGGNKHQQHPMVAVALVSDVEDEDMMRAALALCGLGRRGQ